MRGLWSWRKGMPRMAEWPWRLITPKMRCSWMGLWSSWREICPMIATLSLVSLASVALIGAHFLNGMWLSWRKEVETKSPVAPLSMRTLVVMLLSLVVREMGGWRGWVGWVVLWIETGDGGEGEEAPEVFGAMVPADTPSSTGPCLLPAAPVWLERLGSWRRCVQGGGTGNIPLVWRVAPVPLG